MLGAIEEIAYRKGWIGRANLESLAMPLKKTEYGGYLLKIAREGK